MANGLVFVSLSICNKKHTHLNIHQPASCNTIQPKQVCLRRPLDPQIFYLTGAGLPRLSWQKTIKLESDYHSEFFCSFVSVHRSKNFFLMWPRSNHNFWGIIQYLTAVTRTTENLLLPISNAAFSRWTWLSYIPLDFLLHLFWKKTFVENQHGLFALPVTQPTVSKHQRKVHLIYALFLLDQTFLAVTFQVGAGTPNENWGTCPNVKCDSKKSLV